MDSKIIIARFNEDLNWVNKLNSSSEIIIYNKGKKLESSNKFKEIILPNLGRESQTWLHHIYTNYDNLNKYNIFLQGRIDDLGCMAYSKPDDYLTDLKNQSFSVSRFGLLSPLHWKDNLNIEKDIRYSESWKKKEISRSAYGFREYAKKFLNKIPLFVATSYGGCFAVSREAIRSHNKDFYYSLLSTVNKHINPIESHYLERLWCYIFSKNKYLNKALIDVLKTKIERNILQTKF